jgi:hypothetical protein
MNERYSFRLIRDLFSHKDSIFGELKRASTLTHSSSGAQRPRAISTDESNRRANFEERSRAIAAQRSPRATSPGPSNRGSHRRDASRTRFPVNTGSPTAERRGTTGSRNSLEVPGSSEASPTGEKNGTNGSIDNAVEHPVPSSTRVPLRKHAVTGSLARGVNRDSTGSLRGGPGEESRGVTLEDKPMDD